MPDDISPPFDDSTYPRDAFDEIVDDLIAFRLKNPTASVDDWDLVRARREARVFRALFVKTLALLHDEIARNKR